MSIAARPMAAFWQFGLLAVALAAISSLLIRLCGPESGVALLVMPVFLLLFQLPYLLLGFLAGGSGLFQSFFHGSPWRLIPLWTVLIFLWNGSLAALFSIAHAYLKKREGARYP